MSELPAPGGNRRSVGRRGCNEWRLSRNGHHRPGKSGTVRNPSTSPSPGRRQGLFRGMKTSSGRQAGTAAVVGEERPSATFRTAASASAWVRRQRRLHWYYAAVRSRGSGSAGRIAVMLGQYRRLGCILPVELFARCEDLAHMSARPQTERFHRLPQGAAELGQFVIHALRSGGEDSPLYQAVPF